jgi:hypothetical protein
MKQLLIIISLLCSITLSTTAQEGLRINEVFEGHVVSKQFIRESLIKGDNLAPYNLKVLHTAKCEANSRERITMEQLFEEDMKQRISDDNSNMEMESRDGHLYYAIVQIADTKKGTHRYICYQCRDRSSHFDITLVYMEGKASLADLRKTFKKKE